MASVAINGQGDCLTDLGRLDEAAATYEEAITRKEKLDDKRGVAVSKFQLGTVRWYQKRYKDALEIYTEGRDIFEKLGEMDGVAQAWHGIGNVYSDGKQVQQAEDAYRRALAIHVQQKNRTYEASILNQLGLLYEDVGRLEEAVTFYRQAADIYVELHDLSHEGLVRNNIANVLRELRRYDEARRELHRAIECKQPFGHAALPWTTWAILYNLEQATGNAQAAAQARQQAVEAYLAYRRAGGENQGPGARLYAKIVQDIRAGDTNEVGQFLTQVLKDAKIPNWLKIMSPKLQAILAGERNPALAEDSDLDYDDAVELRLLLEELGKG
jgi:tetratricopeptide (TPR) repeat protein